MWTSLAVHARAITTPLKAVQGLTLWLDQQAYMVKPPTVCSNNCHNITTEAVEHRVVGNSSGADNDGAIHGRTTQAHSARRRELVTASLRGHQPLTDAAKHNQHQRNAQPALA